MTPLGKILFICTGNTCRSPMAEGIFTSLSRSRAFPHAQWEASSAGIAASKGSPASRETVEILRQYGIDLSKHQSTPVSNAILKESTLIFTMTEVHMAILFANFPQYANKIHLVSEGTTGKDIPDPIGCGKRAYEQVAATLEKAISTILNNLPPPQ